MFKRKPRGRTAAEITDPALVLPEDEKVHLRLPTRREVKARLRGSDQSSYLQPFLALPERRIFWAFTVAWFGAQAWFWTWWFRPEHWVTIPGMAVLTAVLVLGLLYQLGTFTAGRARIAKDASEAPQGRIAMIVTHAPSEPWEVVQHTLEHLLKQDFDRPYDVWLADEIVTPEADEWCRDHGVFVSSREGISSYHRQTWPRRTRCKEGNLAYFYDHYGYSLYDFVCQFDADHAPWPSYLGEVMAHFADPGVGYVAAPSLNTRSVERSAVGRGRVYKEALFHGVYQAGTAVPSCIGSHYAVRTSALKEIGGLGPELAEDYSTTLAMQAHGWRGAFAMNAIAEGDAPATFTDAMTQEMQWARSLISVLYGHSRRLVRRAPFLRRVDLRWSGSFYAAIGLSMIAATLLPIIALTIDVPWINLPILDFVVRAAIPALLLSGLMTWSRGQGLLRPLWGKVFGWETFVFEFARWPWVVVGVVQGAWGSVSGRAQRDFRITPKDSSQGRALPLVAIAPYIVLTWISLAAIATFATVAADARGYLLLAWINAATAALTGVLVLTAHMVENPLAQRERHFVHYFATWGSLGATLAVAMVGAYILGPDLTGRALMSDGLLLSPSAIVLYVLLVGQFALTWWANGRQAELLAHQEGIVSGVGPAPHRYRGRGGGQGATPQLVGFSAERRS